MLSGARYQAVYEIVAEVLKDEQPADKIVNDYIRARKYIGAKDRRFIVEGVWQIIRRRCRLTFDAQSSEARRIWLYWAREKIDEVFDGAAYGPEALSAEEAAWLEQENEQPYPDWVEAECPQWLFAKIKDVAFWKALNEPAETNVRAHGIERDELQQRLLAEGIESTKGGYSPYCLKIKGRLVLNNCMAWQDGALDVQDEASQIATILTDVRPEHKIVDYCCGAGGKALAMSNLLKGQGHILAYDIDGQRLENIKPRMARMGVHNIELTDIIAGSDKEFDRFVLDAPCSGTGSWRRAPDAKFRLTPEKLESLKRTQAELLRIAADKTKVGGRIIYMTCSVLPEENEGQVEKFLQENGRFARVNLRRLWESKLDADYPCDDDYCLRMSPPTTGTDGFFVSELEKIG